MYKILLIDEEKETFDDFRDYVENSASNKNLDIITIFPMQELETMVEHIIKVNPHALITDFVLNEIKTDIGYNVPYNGVELVEELLKIRFGFPCFVLTSFDDLAVNASEDVNVVYVKNILHNNKEDSKARVKFLDRVIKQIEHYQTKIKSAEEELIELIELRNSGKANIVKEKRLIELDTFLESIIDRRNSIPADFKKLSNDNRLNKLLSKIDKILEKTDDGP
ncbi:hypothetical protein [Leptospira koniambonensis]|uniref:hypothetical protein n=1 Tax=Leptospira koniambonensis TaxID=2484950 RepID=UPI003EB901DA